MKYIIRRTEKFNGTDIVKYVDNNGWFNGIEEARRFDSIEDAEEYIELEKSNTTYYDRESIGECTFEVEECKWYAVQVESTDDWSTGSYDYNKAVKMLIEQGKGLIAVIDEDTNYCIEEIEYSEI